MSGALHLRNLQRARKLNRPFLKEVVTWLVEEHLGIGRYELGVLIVGPQRMAMLNQQHLGHTGATDVITFDYTDPAVPDWLAGDLFVCLEVARLQSFEFGTAWESELVRYIVHGILHLRGHDDHSPQDRKRMKKEESRLVRRLESRFPLHELSKWQAGRKRTKVSQGAQMNAA